MTWLTPLSGRWIAGHLWGLPFPLIKRLWTSSFVCVAGGWSLLLLATFYYLIDVRGWRNSDDRLIRSSSFSL